MPQRLCCILIFHRNLYGGSSSKTETREPFVNRRQMITRTTKTLLAVAHDLLTWRRFDDHKLGPRYRGVYATYQEAEAALPKGRDHGFHEDVPDFFKKTQLGFNQSDYPVLLRLLQALKPGCGDLRFWRRPGAVLLLVSAIHRVSARAYLDGVRCGVVPRAGTEAGA